jgi:hypothetical protein
MLAVNKLRLVLLGIAAALVFSSAAQAAGPFQFYSVTPCRIVDTRNPNGVTGGPALAGQATRSFPVTGLCGVPSTAQAAVLNVTVVAPTGGGHVRIWPYGATMPLVSTINFDPGEPAIANGAIVPLSSDPTLSISTFLGASAGNTADLVIDVTGYFQ